LKEVYKTKLLISSSNFRLKPLIPSARSLETLSKISGLSKCVVACTIAQARFSGSADLKIPEPTKMLSAPSWRNKAASAGVATPPAEKCGTGNLPSSATQSINSKGAFKIFA
jgi:hypothetical protein